MPVIHSIGSFLFLPSLTAFAAEPKVKRAKCPYTGAAEPEAMRGRQAAPVKSQNHRFWICRAKWRHG
jgi:hypothetical protein